MRFGCGLGAFVLVMAPMTAGATSPPPDAPLPDVAPDGSAAADAMPDMAVGPGPDASVAPDVAAPSPDAPGVDVAPEAETPVGGCDCQVAAPPALPALPLVWLILLCAHGARRRQRPR